MLLALVAVLPALRLGSLGRRIFRGANRPWGILDPDLLPQSRVPAWCQGVDWFDKRVRAGRSTPALASATTTISFKPRDNEFAGGIFTSDISIQYARGDRKQRGVFFGGNLDIAYFDYLNEPTIGDQAPTGALLPAAESTIGQEILSEADGRSIRDGQDPFEFGYGAYVGIKGAKTTVTLNGSFSQDNGNSIDQQRQDREAQRQSSDNYSVGLNATRRLARDL